MNDRFIEYAIDTWGDTVLRAATSVVGNRPDAEDVFSDVFFALWKKGESFYSETELKAWLIRVAVNKAKNIVASAYNRHKARLTENIPAPEVDSDKSDVRAALAKLEPNDRAILYLHYYEGYTYGQIGFTLKMNASSVRSKAARAREKMKEFLKE